LLIHIVWKTGLAWKKTGLPFVSVGSEERNVRYKWDFARASGSTCHSPVKGDGERFEENSHDSRFSNSDSPPGSAPERQRAHAVGTPEMPAEMRLIGKTGFGRHVYEREIFFWLRQKLLAVTQPATHQVLVRGEADALGKQFTEIRDAQTRRARHFFAAQLRGKIGLHQSDSATDVARLRSHTTEIRSLLIVFIHTPAPEEGAGALPKSEEGSEMGRNDNDVRHIEKNIAAHAKENLCTPMPDGKGSNRITDHKDAKQTCQSAL
jgi:hypothetical protein